ncbi:HupE/UreJ family protein [Methylobacterium sp. A54F]
MKRLLAALPAALLLLPLPALAHPGHGDAAGFLHGFQHPLGGLDHVLAMVAVGLLAAIRGGRALWLLPAAFLTMMTGGALLGMAGIALPHAEAGIALSIVAFGIAAAMGLSLPLVGATLLVAAFAVFHGYAHGAEMPEAASGLAYGAGFLAATALLHAAGIGLGLAAGGLTRGRGAALSGGAIAAAGVAILAGAL